MVPRISLRVLGVLALCVCAASVQAQDLKGLTKGYKKAAAPVACETAPKDPSLWDKSVIFGINYAEGNTKTTNINLGGVATRDYENNAWRFQGDFNYGNAADTSDPNKTVDNSFHRRQEVKNNIRGLAEYSRMLDNTWFAGADVAFAHDEIADLKYRVILSPSLGAYLVREDNLKFSLEAGPSYIWERLGRRDDSFAAARIANRFEWEMTDTSKLFEFAEYLVSFEDSDQYIVNAEAGIETAINSFMSLVVSVRDYYINQPAANRRPNDVLTMTALKITL